MQHSRHTQRKRRDAHIKAMTVFGHHLIAAMHFTHRGIDDCSTGIFEMLTRLKQGLRSHHP